MTELELINDLLTREDGYQQDPADRGNAGGGATNWGITARTWGLYKALGRQATRAEIKAITREQAVEFYQGDLRKSPFTRLVAFEPLRVQLFDFAINSGQERAIRWLQRAIGVPVSSTLDERTLAAIAAYPGRLTNNALVAARLKMIDGWTDDDRSQKPLEEGVESRALSFFLG